ncbi:MAG TPA: hypothetical protein PK177_15660 [Burkholderiaceae bacterium]|nr:hypothetical protein [Burkholderiaceae bacterium]
MSSASFGSSRISRAVLAVCGAFALAACGSGSSDDTGPGGQAEAGLTLSGTAATGLAIAAQPVSAKCIGGDGSATTNEDGSYTISVEGDASLPCTLRVTTADGEVLHSIAIGTGSTARANITPVSELIVARLAGGNPAAFFDGFDASSAGALSSESVQAAAVAIVETLKSAGVDLGDVDVLSGELVAATAAGALGNDFDRALDALQDALANSQTTLAQLIEAVAQAAPQPAQLASAVPSLPAELLLKKADANCPSLRSGTYRLLMHLDNEEAGRATTLVFDADTSSASFPSLPDAPLSTTFVADGHCKYVVRFDGEQGQLAVSPAGVGILSLPGDSATFHTGLMFPEQTIPVSALAGDWNSLEWERGDTSELFTALSTEFTITAGGVLTNMKDCPGPRFDVCQIEDAGDAESFAADPAGGYHLVNQAYEDGARVFAYRAGGGEMMIAAVDPTNTLILATRKRAAALPEMGHGMASWAFAIKADGTAHDGAAGPIDSWTPGGMDSSNWTVTARDEAAGTFVRSNGAGTRHQPFRIDAPRQGFMLREFSEHGSEIAFLDFRGMGFTALARTAPYSFFMLSVAKSEPSASN